MASTDIKFYSENFASIKDLSKDLNISDPQWNRLFDVLSNLFEGIYFLGNRNWSDNKEFDNTLNYLSEELLLDKDKQHSEILFRLKNSFVKFNRRLVSQMWDYYEFPCFIFLGDLSNEANLLQINRSKIFYDDIINNIDDILLLYRSFQQDVLWIKGNVNVKELANMINNTDL